MFLQALQMYSSDADGKPIDLLIFHQILVRDLSPGVTPFRQGQWYCCSCNHVSCFCLRILVFQPCLKVAEFRGQRSKAPLACA